MIQCSIQENEHGWGGNGGINPNGIPDNQRATVALAGFLAEGRSQTLHWNPPPIEYTPQLLNSVMECVASLPGDEPAWEVNVPLVGVNNVFGQLSRPDLLLIPENLRQTGIIGPALQDAIRFLNGLWNIVDIMASLLESQESIDPTPFLVFWIGREVQNKLAGG